MILGLTGKYCAGKNVVARHLATKGLFVVEEDEIGHEALAARIEQIVGEFGQRVVGSDGRVDRALLGRIVFSDPDALERLEAIVHPWMVKKTKELVAQQPDRSSVINAAILFKMGLHEICEKVIVVRSLSLIRFARGRRRDGTMWKDFARRQSAQRSLNRAPTGVDTIIVRNNRSATRLERRIDSLLGGDFQG